MKEFNEMMRIKKYIAIVVAVFLFSSFSMYLNATGDKEKDGANDKLDKAIVLFIGSPISFSNNKEMLVDDSNSDVIPYVKNGRTLVPVRYISENFGADVDWENDTKTVKVKKGNIEIEIVIGSRDMYVSNKLVEIDVPAEISNSRTLIPLRAMAEALGKEVFYDRGLIIISDIKDIFDTDNEKEQIDEVINKVNNLPKLTSVKNFESLLKKFIQQEEKIGLRIEMFSDDMMAESFDMPSASVKRSTAGEMAKSAPMEGAMESDSSESNGNDYSKTNVQVQGVDEADVVKTDGEYIYHLKGQNIFVARAYPASEMKIVNKITFKQEIRPIEMFVDKKRLVVIGQQYKNNYYAKPYSGGPRVFIEEEPMFEDETVSISNNIEEDGKLIGCITPVIPNKQMTKATIFNVENKNDITRIRDVDIEGNYVSSRKIQDDLYLVTNKQLYWYGSQRNLETPLYIDTLETKEYKNVAIEDVRYFPAMIEPKYMVIAGIDISSDKPANISTYLGAGTNIYASLENLYVTSALRSNEIVLLSPKDEILDDSEERIREHTQIFKFSMAKSKITYLNKGKVPGNILNQFSMDENKGNFRIATTSNKFWHDRNRSFKNQTSNNLYILDETMRQVGKIEDIAPGESIYSVRFMGDRAYMVTFEKVDPFFVIDVKDPTNPKILGALKLPGYSDYLHPYDDNHIIGFGKDTTVVKDNAYYKGIKIALFDVTDVKNPVAKFTEFIGDRGTESRLLRNHKALLFSKAKDGLLAFPVTLREVNESNKKGSANELRYGEFKFQGAYIYKLDSENGFSLRGRISHMTDDDFLKAGNYYHDSSKDVERIIYINDKLYTVSKSLLKANELKDLSEVNQVKFR